MIRDICVVLGPKKSSTYSSEYASGFSGPAASHLAAPPSPRHEGNAGQAPWRSKSQRGSAVKQLARVIHERFCCNRGFAALAREALS